MELHPQLIKYLREHYDYLGLLMRNTRSWLVPPVTKKLEPIDEYALAYPASIVERQVLSIPYPTLSDSVYWQSVCRFIFSLLCDSDRPE